MIPLERKRYPYEKDNNLEKNEEEFLGNKGRRLQEDCALGK